MMPPMNYPRRPQKAMQAAECPQCEQTARIDECRRWVAGDEQAVERFYADGVYHRHDARVTHQQMRCPACQFEWVVKHAEGRCEAPGCEWGGKA